MPVSKVITEGQNHWVILSSKNGIFYNKIDHVT